MKPYLPIPEFKFPTEELRQWGHRNRNNFHRAREWKNQNSLLGCIIPFSFVKILNDQIELDYNIYNAGTPLIKSGYLCVMEDELRMHVDTRRDASLNFELEGKATTVWEDGSECPYQRGQAMLFNTQIPHAVHPVGSRMSVTFTVTMSFPRFSNLYSKGLIFGKEDQLLNVLVHKPR